jgi:hypothetical protein
MVRRFLKGSLRIKAEQLEDIFHLSEVNVNYMTNLEIVLCDGDEPEIPDACAGRQRPQ